jgi:hypothetical protein
MSVALISIGKDTLKLGPLEKAYYKNKIVDTIYRYPNSETFANIRIIFGKLLFVPSIVGMVFYELLGLVTLAIITIILFLFILASFIGMCKFYKNNGYKVKLGAKQLNYIIILQTILIIVAGIYSFDISTRENAAFKQVEELEDRGAQTFTYELIDLPTNKNYKLEFDIKNYDIGDTSNNPKYEKHIGTSNVYYSQGQENPRVIFKIDEKDNCSIDVIGIDENNQVVKANYEFEFKRVKNELSDVIGGGIEIPYNRKGEIRGKENSIGIYGSENNDESTSVRIKISTN